MNWSQMIRILFSVDLFHNVMTEIVGVSCRSIASGDAFQKVNAQNGIPSTWSPLSAGLALVSAAQLMTSRSDCNPAISSATR